MPQLSTRSLPRAGRVIVRKQLVSTVNLLNFALLCTGQEFGEWRYGAAGSCQLTESSVPFFPPGSVWPRKIRRGALSHENEKKSLGKWYRWAGCRWSWAEGESFGTGSWMPTEEPSRCSLGFFANCKKTPVRHLPTVRKALVLGVVQTRKRLLSELSERNSWWKAAGTWCEHACTVVHTDPFLLLH